MSARQNSLVQSFTRIVMFAPYRFDPIVGALFAMACMIAVQSVVAQQGWSQIQSFPTTDVRSLASVDSTTILAGTYGGGLLISTDKGATWRSSGLIVEESAVWSVAYRG